MADQYHRTVSALASGVPLSAMLESEREGVRMERHEARAIRQADIIERRRRGESLASIGEIWDISPERVRQIARGAHG